MKATQLIALINLLKESISLNMVRTYSFLSKEIIRKWPKMPLSMNSYLTNLPANLFALAQIRNKNHLLDIILRKNLELNNWISITVILINWIDKVPATVLGQASVVMPAPLSTTFNLMAIIFWFNPKTLWIRYCNQIKELSKTAAKI